VSWATIICFRQRARICCGARDGAARRNYTIAGQSSLRAIRRNDYISSADVAKSLASRRWHPHAATIADARANGRIGEVFVAVVTGGHLKSGN
jgi:hypothetical protein